MYNCIHARTVYVWAFYYKETSQKKQTKGPANSNSSSSSGDINKYMAGATCIIVCSTKRCVQDSIQLYSYI
jgi:hypothetical protein